jgi:membrane protein DedA with SNARE-associated domain
VPDLSSFVLRHPQAVLFAVVLAEQVGLPVPAMPFLLGAGALAGMGRLELDSTL